MPDSPKSPIATFAPGKVLATQAPSLAFGLLVAAGALIAAFAVLSSDGITPRSRIAAPLMLMFFGAASVGIFGRGLVDAGRSGPAVEIRGGRLRAFTVGDAGVGDLPRQGGWARQVASRGGLRKRWTSPRDQSRHHEPRRQNHRPRHHESGEACRSRRAAPSPGRRRKVGKGRKATVSGQRPGALRRSAWSAGGTSVMSMLSST